MDNNGNGRRISERSLENLKLGAPARYQGKIRRNTTLLPETIAWLDAYGNASFLIDELVACAKKGKLSFSNHAHNEVGSNHAYNKTKSHHAHNETKSHHAHNEVESNHAHDGELTKLAQEIGHLKEEVASHRKAAVQREADFDRCVEQKIRVERELALERSQLAFLDEQHAELVRQKVEWVESLKSQPVSQKAIALLQDAITPKAKGGSYAANNATGLKKLVEQALVLLTKDVNLAAADD